MATADRSETMSANIRKWEASQLDYRSEGDEYSRYTQRLIALGHGLVVDRVARLTARQQRPPVIVDLGCGPAEFHDRLAHLGGRYAGIEPSRHEVTRASVGPGSLLVRGTAERVPLPSGSADVVLLVSMLDHCFDAPKTVGEAFRLLRPGGIALVLLDSRTRLSNSVRFLLGMSVSHGDHLYYFSPSDVRDLIAPHGAVSFCRTYGFLLGFNVLGEYMPRPMLGAVQAAADRVGRLLCPERGQHFLIEARKPGRDTGPVVPLSPCCPHCGAALDGRPATCGACGRTVSWIRGDIMDALGDRALHA